ncbi:DUF1566 domain-containing protein [Thalassotalea psychrophila]|uniref:DUF1566 domain-containing protein n=1 Tax=Thalassotalea psychrophila TaxID=3065647 RepID=A0ABY9TXR8_9GAMM|nr:DUF1566 domain-containing protein [Colwelliaceae bacterium SQ149]
MKLKNIFTLAIPALISSVAFAQRGEADITYSCMYNVPQTAPNSRFEISEDGASVKDLKTNLTWSRCDLGQVWDNETQQCQGSALLVDWQVAHEKALIYSASNKNEWRVPNIKELGSIIEERCNRPAANIVAFPSITIEKTYISSTPYNFDSTGESVFGMTTDLGYISHGAKSGAFSVKFVHD